MARRTRDPMARVYTAQSTPAEPDREVENLQIIRRAVASAVARNPGSSGLKILGIVLTEIQIDSSLLLSSFTSLFEKAVQACLEHNEIIEINVTSPDYIFSHRAYFPAGYLLQFAPAGCIESWESPEPTPHLQPDQLETAQAFLKMLGNFNDKKVSLYIVNNICPRCGALKPGHFCGA